MNSTLTIKTVAAEARIRAASAQDVPLVLQFIRELAEYENLSHQVAATEAGLRESLFGENPRAEVMLAFVEDTPAGFCLFFHNYSTFLGKSGLYIEDIFVREPFRGQGIGKAFFQRLARIAQERNCGRIEWWVLDWNRPAIDFYERMGAHPMSEWVVYRLTEDRMKALL